MALFKMEPDPFFWADEVGLSRPGVKEPVEIRVKFKYLDKEETEAFFASLKPAAKGEKQKTDLEALSEIMLDWEGPDAVYGKETLANLLRHFQPAALELFRAFRRELLEAKRKN